MKERELCEAASEAMASAYAPYSKCKVGAALLSTSGKIYTGCNIENGSFSATVCAERVAFFKALSDGERDFASIAVCGGRNSKIDGGFVPCGVCRQVMAEFCPPSFQILVVTSEDSFERYSLAELLPHAFGLDKI